MTCKEAQTTTTTTLTCSKCSKARHDPNQPTERHQHPTSTFHACRHATLSLYCFLLCLQRERFTSRLFPPAEFSPDILRRTITQCAKVSGGIPEYFPRCSMGTEAVRVPGRGPSGGARASPGGSAAVLLAEEGNVFHPHQMLRSKKEKERGEKPSADQYFSQ